MLQTVHFSGDPYTVGLQLGRFGAAAVHGLLRPARAWQQVMEQAGSEHLATMAMATRAHYPQIWREIEGLADGLRLPVDEVFAWNCRGDLGVEAGDGCTTLLVREDARALIAHNEDGYPALARHCAIAQLSVTDAAQFTAFVYPGSLPGHTFAVNGWGIAFAVNNIRCLEHRAGLPRQVLGRAALEACTLDDAVAVLGTGNRAGAFHHSMAQAGDARLISLEATPAGCARRLVEGALAHANHLIDPDLGHVPQRITASSAARQRRGEALAARLARPVNMEQGLAFLRNRDDAELPIFRDAPDDPDAENTLASAVFEITQAGVRWRFYPGGSLSPAHQGSILRETR